MFATMRESLRVDLELAGILGGLGPQALFETVEAAVEYCEQQQGQH